MIKKTLHISFSSSRSSQCSIFVFRFLNNVFSYTHKHGYAIPSPPAVFRLPSSPFCRISGMRCGCDILKRVLFHYPDVSRLSSLKSFVLHQKRPYPFRVRPTLQSIRCRPDIEGCCTTS